jgi:hypothetical protein
VVEIHSNSIPFICLQMHSGTQIFRFSFKCNNLLKGNTSHSFCSAKITLKTDPQNSDYTADSGATREVEPWCEEDEVSDVGCILGRC